jgi:hypothetical protein
MTGRMPWLHPAVVKRIRIRIYIILWVIVILMLWLNHSYILSFFKALLS